MSIENILYTTKKTSFEAGRNFNVCFIISPNFGIVDAWLPVLEALKKNTNARVLGMLPGGKALQNLAADDVLVKYCDQLCDGFLIETWRGTWVPTQSLKTAIETISFQNPFLVRAFLGVARRLGLGLDTQRILTGGIKYLGGFTCSHRERLNLEKYLKAVKVVLFDISECGSDYFSAIHHQCSAARWFSLPHGIDTPRTVVVGKRYDTSLLSGRITVYALSEQDALSYKNSFGVPEDKIRVTGVLRHEPSWISQLASSEPVCQSSSQKTVFLASRPANKAFFPGYFKKQALLDIKKTVIEELGYKLIIRRHPKENDKRLFESTLGLSNYGVTWEFANKHPFAVKQSAACAITFLSSVAVDMVACGVPVIEYFDCENQVKDPQFVANKDGRLTTKYQHQGLVLGAKNYKTLRQRIKKAVGNKSEVANAQSNAYKKIYPSPVNIRDAVRPIIKALK